MIAHSGIGEVARVVEAKLFPQITESPGRIASDNTGIRTVFTPYKRLIALDLEDPFVKEGLRINLELLSQMNDYCLEHDIRLLIVLIPTKEHVYANLIENDTTLENSAFLSLFENERAVNENVKSYLEDHNIVYIDLLPEFQQKVDQIQLYPTNSDSHPNKNGYRVIAEIVGRYVQ